MADSSVDRSTPPPTTSRWATIGPALLLAFGVIMWQHLLHAKFVLRTHDGMLDHLPHIGRDALFAVPFAFMAVSWGRLFTDALTVRRPRAGLCVRAAVATEVFFVLMLTGIPLHGWIDERLGSGHVHEGSVLGHALRDALIGQAIALPLLIVALWLVGPGRSVDRQIRLFIVAVVAISPALLLAGVSGFLVLAALAVFGLASAPRVDARERRIGFASMALVVSAVIVPTSIETPSVVSAAGEECSVIAPLRQYEVAAIDVDIVFNAFGDHDPEGKMFVLRNRIADVRAAEASGEVTPGLRDDAIQPLVIRANLGDCLEIEFHNELAGRDASFHVTGLPFTAANAGGNVGFNPNSLAAPGETITYRFQVPSDPYAEGAYVFNSLSDTRYTMSHGLFGTLVLEPEGSRYLDPADPSTELESGWEAIIADPNGVDFREFNILFHEIGDEDFIIRRADGSEVPLLDPFTDVYRPASRALNFRSESFMNRLELENDKSLGYSSYAFGDPATPIPLSYLGEATKTRVSHPGSEMFHVYHLHGGGNRWRRNPKVEPEELTGGLKKVPTPNAQSSRMDSQAIGPGEAFTFEHECGAGGCQQAAGDFLFHCHIGDHYLSGMWALWRVFDTVQADLPEMPPDWNGNYTPPPIAQQGTSLDLLGTQVDGKTIVAEANLVDPSTEVALEEYAAGILPPPGERIDEDDATVWDWQIEYVDGDPTQPLVLGEPDDTRVWANYASETPGERPPVKFNLDNARLAWPHFRPQLGTRPPFSPNGHGGAPWLGEDGDAARPDAVCPSTDVVPGRRVLNYPITALDIPIEIGEGIVKPDGKIYALSENVDDIRAGTSPAEPLVLRSNVGDCSRILLTSEQEDRNHNGDAKVNMHTHMVQFDPQGSDGVVTGYAYEQGVRPYANENRSLTVPAGPGATTIEVTNVDRLRTGIDIGIGLGEGMCDPSTGAPVDEADHGDRACAEVRRIVSIDGTTITLDQPLENEHTVGEAAGVEFAQYLWYSDVDAGTVFWHDHVAFSNWRDGLFGAHVVEPAGSSWHDPSSGEEIRSGPIADIHAPPDSSQGVGQQGSFREVLAMMSDRLDIDGPGTPNISLMNMRTAPLVLRDSVFPFSSVTNGDPDTAILRAYVGDPVVIRGLGVMDREGTIRVSGHRLRQERYLEGAALVDTVHIGISEREDLVLEGGAGGTAGLPGDYLFYNSVARDLEGGAWGLLRVHDTEQTDLQPLPDRGAPAPGNGFPTLTETGGAPPAAVNPSGVCPAGAPERFYDVTALQNPNSIVDFGDRMYARSDQEALLLSGAIQPEPLVMRVNEGDCLRISLTNHFSSERASIDLAKLNAAVHGSAVGWNSDGSAAPGETVEYEFYADAELGTSLFYNLAAPHTIALGAFGAVIVEPAGSTWRNPFGPGEAATGVRADILHPDGNFREHVLLMQESDERIGQNVMPYTIEVRNFSGMNYRNDPFFEISDDPGRLDINPDPSLVFDSETHGDPMNLVRAYVGDPVRLRVGLPAAEQSNTFAIDGHRFPWEPNVEGSTQLANMGMFAGESHDLDLIGGAGGGAGGSTDYLIGNGRGPHVEAGMWGIFRTYDSAQLDLRPIQSPSLLAPSTPRNVSGVGGDAQVAVSWAPPALDGGSPIIGYTVTAAPGGATCTTTGATSCIVSGLTNGTTYRFRATATNAVGTGPPSPASSPVTPVAPLVVPSAPADVSGVGGDAQVAVSWVAPASDGGSPIIGYTVTAAPGGATCTTTGATSCIVSGLTNGTPYTFTVTATNAVGTGPASPASPPITPEQSALTIERWGGANRYATSVRISQETFPAGADAVFLATGASFADALAAGPAAATLGAPVLLTATNQLPSIVIDELQRLAPSVVYVVGGPGAISASVEAQVDAATGADTPRLAGSNRYETAAAVAEFAFPTADTVYVAVGTAFADALSAGAPAGINGRPVILTANNALPAASREQIIRLGNPDVIVLGGPGAVSNAVVTELEQLTAGSVRRVSGTNRYETSVAVSADAFPSADTVFLATGTAFPDALSAAPAAANLAGPILLTTPGCAPDGVIAEVARLGADRLIVLGGPNAVSDAAASLAPCS